MKTEELPTSRLTELYPVQRKLPLWKPLLSLFIMFVGAMTIALVLAYFRIDPLHIRELPW